MAISHRLTTFGLMKRVPLPALQAFLTSWEVQNRCKNTGDMLKNPDNCCPIAVSATLECPNGN